ncbi:magnesium protoporphyrin O-methyltransferase [Luminiphilus syltensis NOR5-1B]|uniref:Magnesium protoporphyrin IX methyltransferase n=1 Tax=Luminiphilus syltensis NOR5-1B TaxID=565045 RepID=B8KT36_9GAMM|nr:magnesium protoporphyrin IX methyltransferase [Luminiphilus syltensis]EED34228.1 magnesium protoporphyrin O-methyltransferase [Luminiphilus syltensis NOR5-1B]
MPAAQYQQRRDEIEHYFDRTAADTWARLTSDAPVGKIRQTVRAGRDTMRATLLSWLPDDMRGLRLLDAGCGTGALAFEAAMRGADVVAIDLSPTLVALAAQRIDADQLPGSIDFQVGDMRRMDLGEFDHVVAMDSLIHYAVDDGLETLRSLAPKVSGSFVFTFAPRTNLLAAMHAVGQIFPRGNRSPAIEPVSERRLFSALDNAPAFRDWQRGRSQRVASGFYTSQACELKRR